MLLNPTSAISSADQVQTLTAFHIRIALKEGGRVLVKRSPTEKIYVFN